MMWIKSIALTLLAAHAIQGPLMVAAQETTSEITSESIPEATSTIESTTTDSLPTPSPTPLSPAAQFVQYLKNLPPEEDTCFQTDPASKFLPIANATRCIQSIPFQPDVNADLIVNMQKALPLYVFRDIAAKYPSNGDRHYKAIQSNTDIVKEVETIGKKHYKDDVTFHNALFEAFLKMNDAHTQYRSSCYHSWRFFQPWSLVSKAVSKDPRGRSDQLKQAIYIQDFVFSEQDMAEPLSHWTAEMNTSPRQFIGWQVIAIDGKPALEALRHFANHEVGVARDASVRLNLALGRFDWMNGNWKAFFGAWSSRTKLPKSQVVSYKLMAANGTVVDVAVPFVARKPVEFRNSAEMWLRICLAYSKETHGFTSEAHFRAVMRETPFEVLTSLKGRPVNQTYEEERRMREWLAEEDLARSAKTKKRHIRKKVERESSFELWKLPTESRDLMREASLSHWENEEEEWGPAPMEIDGEEEEVESEVEGEEVEGVYQDYSDEEEDNDEDNGDNDEEEEEVEQPEEETFPQPMEIDDPPLSRKSHKVTDKKRSVAREMVIQEVPFVPGADFNPRAVKPRRSSTGRDPVDLSRPLVKGDTEAFYLMNNNKTAVFKLSSFSGSPVAGSQDMIATWNKGFAAAVENGAETLLLDFSSNGGGIICLGYALAQFLFPQTVGHSTDFITSPLFDLFVTQAAENEEEYNFFYFGRKWLSPANQSAYTSNDWMKNGPSYRRGGKTSRYSEKALLNCNGWKGDLVINGTAPTAPPFPPEKVAVLTNGYCGSTCALVARVLSDVGVKTIAYGGYLHEPMAFSEFAGGQVTSYGTVLGYARDLRVSRDPLAPQLFKVNAALSMTIREAYSQQHPEIPLEFDYKTADARIHVTDENLYNPSMLWSQAVELMNWQ